MLSHPMKRIGNLFFFASALPKLVSHVICVLQKPQLISGGKKFYHFLREQCPVVSETYYPTFWCWESRIQTLLRPFVTAKPGVVYRK